MNAEVLHERPTPTAPIPVRTAPPPVPHLGTLTRDDLAALASHRGPALSLLLPTPWRGAEARQVAIGLKVLLRDAEAQAAARRLPAETVAALLDPVRALIDDADFWRQSGRGAALFTAPGLFRAFRLIEPVPARALVGERFVLRPLLGRLDDLAYRVLAVSRNRVRLLEGGPEALREMELGPVPGSFDQALGELQFDRGLQHHSATPAGRGRRSVTFHGHGSGDEENLEDDLFRYFRLIAEALPDRLGNGGRPMVIAAAAEHLPLLRRARLPGTVLDEAAAGNPDHLSEHELHARTWPAVEAWARRAAAAEVERVHGCPDRARLTHEVSAVLRAAAAGRVDTLLTARGAELWGTFDPATQGTALHAAPEPGDEELINRAACETLAGRGAVHELAPGDLPAPMLALRRY